MISNRASFIAACVIHHPLSAPPMYSLLVLLLMNIHVTELFTQLLRLSESLLKQR